MELLHLVVYEPGLLSLHQDSRYTFKLRQVRYCLTTGSINLLKHPVKHQNYSIQHIARGLAWSVGAHSKHNGDENYGSFKRAISIVAVGLLKEFQVGWSGFGRGISTGFLMFSRKNKARPGSQVSADSGQSLKERLTSESGHNCLVPYWKDMCHGGQSHRRKDMKKP